MLSWDDYDENESAIALAAPAAAAARNVIIDAPAPVAPRVEARVETPRAIVKEVELPITDDARSNLEKAQAAIAALDAKAEFRAHEDSLERVTVDQKRMINCRADLNQLVPFKYDWAWQKYLDGCANHWMPQEINMTADIALWKNDGGLSDDERCIVNAVSAFFTADSLVANNLARHLSLDHDPECAIPAPQASKKRSIHTHINTSFSRWHGRGEIFNMYHEVRPSRAKHPGRSSTRASYRTRRLRPAPPQRTRIC